MSESLRVRVERGGIEVERGEVAPVGRSLPVSALARGWRRELVRAGASALELSIESGRAALTIDVDAAGARWSMTVPLARFEPHDVTAVVRRARAHARIRARGARAVTIVERTITLGPHAVAQWLAELRNDGASGPVEIAAGTAALRGTSIDHFDALVGHRERWRGIGIASAGRVGLALRQSALSRALADPSRRGRTRHAVVFGGTVYRAPALLFGPGTWQQT